MPTLLTWGADDPLVSPSVGEAMAGRISDVSWEVMPACGHLPTLEQPDQSATLFSGLVERVRVGLSAVEKA